MGRITWDIRLKQYIDTSIIYVDTFQLINSKNSLVLFPNIRVPNSEFQCTTWKIPVKSPVSNTSCQSLLDYRIVYKMLYSEELELNWKIACSNTNQRQCSISLNGYLPGLAITYKAEVFNMKTAEIFQSSQIKNVYPRQICKFLHDIGITTKYNFRKLPIKYRSV